VSAVIVDNVDAAEKATRRVNGVKAIAEEIEIRFASDPKTSDGEIAQRILDLYSWDVSLPRDTVKVKVEKGWVTLTGQADWQYQKKDAAKLAGRITGVKGVSNLIEVQTRPSTIDLRDRIAAAFKRSSVLDANSLNISVEGHTVKRQAVKLGDTNAVNAQVVSGLQDGDQVVSSGTATLTDGASIKIVK
jgi:osmotically-inducible protein OsmY